MLLVVTDDQFFDHNPGLSHPERPDRLTAALDADTSVHQSPLYPGSGGISEIGVGRGEGFTVLEGGYDLEAVRRLRRKWLGFYG